jgi:predicted alpha/beta superfamily hydrolase
MIVSSPMHFISTSSPAVRAILPMAVLAVSAPILPGQAADHGFRLEGYSTATQVSVTGSVYGWDPAAMPLERHPDGVFATTTTIGPGRHLYKFVINGETWIPDPANPRTVDDGYGGRNSVLVIGNENPVEAARAARPNYFWGETTWSLTGAPDDAGKWLPIRLESEHPVYDGSQTTAGQGTGRLLLARDVVPLPESVTKSDQRTSYPLRARRVLVWLPKEYDTEPDRRFPVIYMHDGQNIFDDARCCFGHGGWEVNTALAGLGSRYAAIIVGVPNSPERLLDLGLGPDVLGRVPTDYARYMAESIKPLIDREFRTLPDREHTAVGGSSMGGIASIHAADAFPEIYGRVAALSPAFWYRDDRGTSLGTVIHKRGRFPARLYVDSGNAGVWNDGVSGTRDFVRLAIGAGFKPGEDFLHIEEDGAEHNERAWRRRTPAWVKWLLDPRVTIPSLQTGGDVEGPAGG